MPGENPFEGFEFPTPLELEPLPPYTGPDANYGHEETYGGEGGDMPRLEVNDWDKGGDGDLRALRLYDLHQNDANDWVCYITAGLALDNHILNMADCDSSGGESAEQAVEVRIPTVEGVGIIDPVCSSGWERPLLTLPGVPCYVYCKFKTDNHGNIILDSDGTVQIVAFTNEKLSINHSPPDPDRPDGREGEYYWLLAHVCLDSAGNAAISHRHQSNILWPGEFGVSNDSAANGSNIYRKFDRCKGDYKLRKVYGCYAITDAENAELIELSLAATNVGTNAASSHPTQPGGYTGANVYVDSAAAEVCGEEAKFRKLVANTRNGITPQILPFQNGNTVEMRGNGHFGTLSWKTCDSAGGEGTTTILLTWEDGLITLTESNTIVAGCCCSSGESGGPS
jgi:hypothetical protein